MLLIHEVVFSKCDLKTKTYNHFTKSDVDGFQRKERQAPIIGMMVIFYISMKDVNAYYTIDIPIR